MQYSPSERQLRELALACFSNAQESHEEAFLLAKHNHVRSIALAILGAEEFAKSIAFTVAVFRPDERDTLSKALKKSSGGFYQHKVKHLATHIIDGILIETDQGIEVMESESGSPMSPWERLRSGFFSLSVMGLTS